jgi:hypothetical protein
MATPEQWPKIKEIVGAALEREPKERGAFLDQACSQDRELRAEVESLLAAHADAVGLSENPRAATTACVTVGSDSQVPHVRSGVDRSLVLTQTPHEVQTAGRAHWGPSTVISNSGHVEFQALWSSNHKVIMALLLRV